MALAMAGWQRSHGRSCPPSGSSQWAIVHRVGDSVWRVGAGGDERGQFWQEQAPQGPSGKEPRRSDDDKQPLIVGK